MQRLLLSLAILVLAACASATTTQGTTSPGAPRAGAADFISQSEIAQHAYSTAFEIVSNLRPTMLRLRSATLSQPSGTAGVSADGASSVNAVVFLDDVRMGDPSQLNAIPANTVKEIRYINARDATTRWGTGYMAGVIQVVTKK